MASSVPKESPSNNPGLQATPDDATKGYIMQQTVLVFSQFISKLRIIIVDCCAIVFDLNRCFRCFESKIPN